METVAQPPADAELDFLTHWGDADSRPRAKRAAVYSVAAHVAAVLLLVLIPAGADRPRTPEPAHVITPLIDPPTQLTQKAPNTSKITKEFEAAAVEPRPRIQIPAGPPKPRPAVIPPAVPPKPQAIPLPEAPNVQATVKAPTDLPQLPAPPPPQIQATEQKPVFETPSAPQPVAPGQNRLPIPDTSVGAAVRGAMRSGGGGGAGMVLGDPNLSGPGGGGAGLNLPPSPASRPSNIQLLSDPMGVDFRPYLTQILTIVRRNWFSVMPESAKLGLSGRVGVLFSIAKSGAVTKANYASQSGARALDQAAIAAISMSNPFPPLPGEFKGERIVLQFNFAYNIPK